MLVYTTATEVFCFCFGVFSTQHISSASTQQPPEPLSHHDPGQRPDFLERLLTPTLNPPFSLQRGYTSLPHP